MESNLASHVNGQDTTRFNIRELENFHDCDSKKGLLRGICLSVLDSPKETQTETTGIRDSINQDCLELLPVSLQVFFVELAVAVCINLFDCVSLNLLPVEAIDVSGIHSSLDSHEAHSEDKGNSLAHLLQSHATAVANDASKAEFGKDGLRLVNDGIDRIFLFSHGESLASFIDEVARCGEIARDSCTVANER